MVGKKKNKKKEKTLQQQKGPPTLSADLKNISSNSFILIKYPFSDLAISLRCQTRTTSLC